MSFNILNVIWFKDRCLLPPKADKKVLYQKIDEIRSLFSIKMDDYPIDIFQLLHSIRDLIEVEIKEFSGKLGGFLIYNNLPNKSAMILNKNSNLSFSAAHEIIHFLAHGGYGYDYLLHSSKPSGSCIEWQANEGAAELLLPYKLIVPEFVNLEIDTKGAIEYLAQKYKVSKTIIAYRLNSLTFEINQYIKEKDINKVTLISQRQLKNYLG
ncbi:MAG: ImmA/IrrE family metallo-endopeptidase [Candidatus Omnitrophota bacterium]